MAEIITMPRMTDSMEQGNVVAWLKKVGDKVESGDVLAEVETDKATMELNSYKDGTLLYIGVESGNVNIGDILAIIGKPGEDISGLLNSKTAAPEVAKPAETITPSQAVPTETAIANSSQAEAGDRIKASPLAKSIASESGVDLSKVAGSGEQGRIVKKDVEQFLQSNQPAAAPSTPTTTSSNASDYTDTPISQMRKVIAKRLSESKFTAPHFYLTIEINMDKAIEMRQKINEVVPVKVSFNDMVVKGVSLALKNHPVINSSWMGTSIRTNHQINIGVAVAIEDGLMVPVIRNADQKSLSAINTEVKTLAGKAKDRKLQPEEMSGNTFTISNLGMFDIDEFTAIINPPDACILAIGSIQSKPIVKDNQVVPGNIMKVTLSCDHRVVDGVSGAQFLQTFKGLLEEPFRLLV
ncbi:MAG: pyruvate dehydrogenase complex dihydrolipoamide acetyltransferase [Saprospiraceae bacterium]|nr:pyruvate dehydrogenase complex dihydrolipoamide acetyltransferase [Saprospiraceae bacterium]